ncbi:DUF3499 family protein, partial [Corynebacterium bovis]
MTDYRQCSRPGCARPAVATLVYSYARQVATIGPLRLDDDPHSWDLCQNHVRRTTVPQGWDLVTEPGVDPAAGHGAGDGQQDGPRDEEDDLSEDDLLALVEATDPAANPRPSADRPEVTTGRPARQVPQGGVSSGGGVHLGAADDAGPGVRVRVVRRSEV